MTRHEPAEDCVDLELQFGQLRTCALRAAALLAPAARSRYPQTAFEVVGQSGLQFLLDPSSATWNAANPDAPAGDSADAERQVVAATSTLTAPAGWLEELVWTNGPSKSDVDEHLTRQVSYIGAGATGVGESGRRYPTHFLRRTYTAEAFAFYALAHHDHGREVLASLGAPDLPAPFASGESGDPGVVFKAAHQWLATTDLRWLTSQHPAHTVLRTLVRLMPEYHDGIADPAEVHRGADELLDVALGICQPM